MERCKKGWKIAAVISFSKLEGTEFRAQVEGETVLRHEETDRQTEVFRKEGIGPVVHRLWS